MAYLKHADECHCATCKGSWSPGEDVIGGWICGCPCHRGEKKPEIKISALNIKVVKSVKKILNQMSK